MMLLNAEVEIVKRNELHTFIVLPKRWISERSLGWLDHVRRLWKNGERKLCTIHQMLVLAFIALLLRNVSSTTRIKQVQVKPSAGQVREWTAYVAGNYKPIELPID